MNISFQFFRVTEKLREKKVTYSQAQDKIFNSLVSLGWEKSGDLKIRWVKVPHTEMKVWFKSQSIHIGQHRPTHRLHVEVKRLASLSS